MNIYLNKLVMFHARSLLTALGLSSTLMNDALVCIPPQQQMMPAMDEPERAFSVYPNPSSDFIIINGSGRFNVELYDLQGKRIYTSGGHEDFLLLQEMHLTKGLYILYIVPELAEAEQHLIVIQ